MHRKETSPRRAICNIDVEHAGPPCHVARDGRGAAAMQFLADCSCRAPSRSSDAPQTTLLTTTGRQPTGRLLESVGMTKLMMVVVAMMGAVAPARESEDVLFRGEMEPVTPAALALQLVTTTLQILAPTNSNADGDGELPNDGEEDSEAWRVSARKLARELLEGHRLQTLLAEQAVVKGLDEQLHGVHCASVAHPQPATALASEDAHHATSYTYYYY